jgi:hypothetical protein
MSLETSAHALKAVALTHTAASTSDRDFNAVMVDVLPLSMGQFDAQASRPSVWPVYEAAFAGYCRRDYKFVIQAAADQ